MLTSWRYLGALQTKYTPQLLAGYCIAATIWGTSKGDLRTPLLNLHTFKCQGQHDYERTRMVMWCHQKYPQQASSGSWNRAAKTQGDAPWARLTTTSAGHWKPGQGFADRVRWPNSPVWHSSSWTWWCLEQREHNKTKPAFGPFGNTDSIQQLSVVTCCIKLKSLKKCMYAYIVYM